MSVLDLITKDVKAHESRIILSCNAMLSRPIHTLGTMTSQPFKVLLIILDDLFLIFHA